MTGLMAALLVLVLVEALVGCAVRHDRYFAVMAGFAGLGICVGLLRGLSVGVVSIGPPQAVGLFLVLLLFVQSTGRPMALARLVGVSMPDPAREFDWALYREVDRFGRLLAGHPGVTDIDANARWRARVLAGGPQVIDAIRRLPAPDPDWARLRDDYARTCQLTIDEVRLGDDEARRELIARMDEDLTSRREELRARGRSPGGVRPTS